ncbi:GGDEF domain-containing protein [Ciceribacter sp. L1K22]|uniref:GGDEF domain-containing protein n=1 Tax=Ciceribacter sp. L1K22 TaxID=2820275 RepID=UPI001ABDB3D4|nr:GGDEF domain-containing protein [Ciceribacter sp. L1K22]MBO3759812.1 GGDEF domain-containing protein [Ciceribacter sp. L1K22]
MDLKTAFLLWTTQAGTLALLLVAVWLHDRSKYFYLNFGVGFAAHGIGFGLVALRGQIPDLVSIQLANSLSLAAFAFWGTALAQLDRKRIRPLSFLPLALWLTGNLLPFIRDDLSNRAALFNVAAAVGFGLLAFMVLKNGESSRQLRWALAGIWTIQSSTSLLLGVSVIMADPLTFTQVHYNTSAGVVNVICFVAAIAVLTKMFMEMSEEHLRTLVRTDPLTGALNRRGFIDAFRAIRSKAPSPLTAVAIFDLDHFKRINDTFGHDTGDDVLVAFADLCLKLLPKDGVFGRTGGEEFAVALPIERVKDAALYAEAIRHSLATQPVNTRSRTVSVTVSIGIAAVATENAGLDKLLSDADRALYRAKERGRNCTTIWNDNKATDIHEDLAQAIDDRADRQVAVLRRLSVAGGEKHA